jgi:hypothetical protein
MERPDAVSRRLEDLALHIPPGAEPEDEVEAVPADLVDLGVSEILTPGTAVEHWDIRHRRRHVDEPKRERPPHHEHPRVEGPQQLPAARTQ